MEHTMKITDLEKKENETINKHIEGIVLKH